jgi:hypothetical protein
MAIMLCLCCSTATFFISCGKDNSESENESVKVTGVSLDKTALTLETGETETLVVTVVPDDATNKAVAWTSSNSEVASVDNNGTVTAIVAGTAVIIVTTNDGGKTATCEVTVLNPQTFDEGVLINGLTWATRNVDAPGTFAANPEDAGMFYQFNSNVGWSSTDPLVNSDGGTTWEDLYLASNMWEYNYNPSPAGWRIPTRDELQSLWDGNKVRRELTTYNGVYGCMFTDKTNGNSVFLPAAGCRDHDYDGVLCGAGAFGAYRNSQGDFRTFGSGCGGGWYYLKNGYSVRCIKY